MNEKHTLLSSILVPEYWKSHFRALKFQNFLGQNNAPRPPHPPPPKKKGTNDPLLIQSVTLFKPAAYFNFYWNPCVIHVPQPCNHSSTLIHLHFFCPVSKTEPILSSVYKLIVLHIQAQLFKRTFQNISKKDIKSLPFKYCPSIPSTASLWVITWSLLLRCSAIKNNTLLL